MARRARIPRASKPKPAPITYEINEEITSIATALMGRFEAHYLALRSFRIAYLMVVGGREPSRDRIDGNWAGITKEHPREKALHDFDLVLWIRQSIWKVLDAKQHEALVAHQLDHFTTNDKGELVRQKHDVEDFAFVARQWGDWHEGVTLYGKQLSLFGQPDPKPGNGNGDAFADIDAKVADQKAERTEGEPTPIRPRRSTSDQPGATS